MTFYEECAFTHGKLDAERGVITNGGAHYYQKFGVIEPKGFTAYQRGFKSVAGAMK